MGKKVLLFFIIIFCSASSYCQHKSDSDKTLIDFFKPIENKVPLTSKGTWGDINVLPRDTANGLEDTKMRNWCYWDGSSVKDTDGKYHIYASRWSQSFPHSLGWTKDSKGIHAVSDNLFGPYKDLELLYQQWNNGKGTNIIGMKMSDGRYAVVSSEITNGEVFVSDTPYGPFKFLGEIKVDNNGFNPGWSRYDELNDGAVKGGGVGRMANVMIFVRPDGRYMLLGRYCVPMISDNGILGPYKVMADRAWWKVKGMPQCKMEDPTIWFSNGLYHIVVNYHGSDTSFHLTSEDGISNWKFRGKAFGRSMKMFKHTDGTIEDWYTVQRPTVYLENGEVKAFNFSVIDVFKGKDLPNDNHGSKIMVLPFDGKGFAKHIKNIIEKDEDTIFSTPLPEEWKSTHIGTDGNDMKCGYDKIVNTICVKTRGRDFLGKKDDFNFIYKKRTNDMVLKGMVLSPDVSKANLQAGYMLRSSLDDNAPFVYASFSKDRKFRITLRNAIGEKPKVIYCDNVDAPCWVMFEKIDTNVKCYISCSNRMNWKKVCDINMNLDKDYYVGMASSSDNDKDFCYARYKDIDLHTYGDPKNEGILRHTFPDTIPVKGDIKFEVEMESQQVLDAWVELQNINTGEKLPAIRQRFWTNGTQQMIYPITHELKKGDKYWFVIKAVPMHFHDCMRVQADFKKVVVE